MRISILTMIKNEAQRLPEWLYFHKNVHDIDRFVFYLDGSEDNSKSVLDSLKEEYNIEYFYSSNTKSPLYSKLDRQIDSLTKGSIYLKNISDWIIAIDVDEFIVPNKDKRLKDVLVNIDKRLYIPMYFFRPVFDVRKSITEQCFYRVSDEEQKATNPAGKSIYKTSEYNGTTVYIHYGPTNIRGELSSWTDSLDFRIHHLKSQMTFFNSKYKYEVFDNSIVKYFPKK